MNETITVDTHTEAVTVESETIRRVHFDMRCVEMGPHEANPAWVHLRAAEDTQCEYFFSLDISLPAHVAYAIGKALVAQATEMGGAS